jgi:archaeal type IV pilus assembly protein PilA
LKNTGVRNIMKRQNESAVSPVVGVMLMLVVVIIIGAVVSGFAGNLVGGKNQKVPQLTMDVQIANSGHWSTSYFKGEVTGVDAPISTRDLKIVTSWSKSLNNGTTIRGGATTTPGVVNVNYIYSTHGSYAFDLWRLTVPQGYGTGVGQNWSSGAGNIFWTVDGHGTEYNLKQGTVTNSSWWGNYYLQAGTAFLCRPFGGSNSGQSSGTSQLAVGYGINGTASRYQYIYSTSDTHTCLLSMEGGLGYPAVTCAESVFFPYPTVEDPEPTAYIPSLISGNSWDPRTYSIDQMQGVLGKNWNLLRAGDKVNVKIIHIPTGKTVWQKDVIVEGSIA